MDDELIVGCITVTSSQNGADPIRYAAKPEDIATLADTYTGYTQTASTDTTERKSVTLVNGGDTVVIVWELYRYLSGQYLPEFFRAKPLPSILVTLLDSALKREVESTIDVLRGGGLIRDDDVGILRLQEYGASDLQQISLLGPNATRPDRLLAISRLTESFSKLKGQKKAIKLILQLLGMSGEVIEYDDERRGTAPFNQGLEPGEVVVIGGINPAIGADLLAANPGKSAEQVLTELIDLFAWAHIRFAGILVAEVFLAEWNYNPQADMPVVCLAHRMSSTFCPSVALPEFSYHPITDQLIEGAAIGTRVRVDKFVTGLMKHRITIGPYGCTDVDGNLQEQWNIGDPGFVVGGDFTCDLKEMNGIGVTYFAELGLYECPNGDQWNIGDPGFVVGGYCPQPSCFGSTLQYIVT